MCTRAATHTTYNGAVTLSGQNMGGHGRHQGPRHQRHARRPTPPPNKPATALRKHAAGLPAAASAARRWLPLSAPRHVPRPQPAALCGCRPTRERAAAAEQTASQTHNLLPLHASQQHCDVTKAQPKCTASAGCWWPSQQSLQGGPAQPLGQQWHLPQAVQRASSARAHHDPKPALTCGSAERLLRMASSWPGPAGPAPEPGLGSMLPAVPLPQLLPLKACGTAAAGAAAMEAAAGLSGDPD